MQHWSILLRNITLGWRAWQSAQPGEKKSAMMSLSPALVSLRSREAEAVALRRDPATGSAGRLG